MESDHDACWRAGTRVAWEDGARRHLRSTGWMRFAGCRACGGTQQIIAGGRDTAVPPGNGEFLHERLPKSKRDFIDAGHFLWEDGADEYAALVTS